MLSADEVPITPTGSKPDDDIGLSSSAFPDARLSILLAPLQHVRRPPGSCPPVPQSPYWQRAARATDSAGRWFSTYSPPRTTSAQATRAILLASAIAATLNFFWLNRRSSLGSAFSGWRFTHDRRAAASSSGEHRLVATGSMIESAALTRINVV